MAIVAVDRGPRARIDATTHTALQTIGTSSRPSALAISPDGSLVYVSCNFAATLDVIDAETSRVVSSIPVGGSPGGPAFLAPAG